MKSLTATAAAKRAKSRPFGAVSSTNSAHPRAPITRERLREIRKRNGLSRAAFGAELGLCAKSIEGWEYGTRVIPPYIDFLVRYYDRYGALDGN